MVDYEEEFGDDFEDYDENFEDNNYPVKVAAKNEINDTDSEHSVISSFSPTALSPVATTVVEDPGLITLIDVSPMAILPIIPKSPQLRSYVPEKIIDYDWTVAPSPTASIVLDELIQKSRKKENFDAAADFLSATNTTIIFEELSNSLQYSPEITLNGVSFESSSIKQQQSYSTRANVNEGISEVTYVDVDQAKLTGLKKSALTKASRFVVQNDVQQQSSDNSESLTVMGKKGTRRSPRSLLHSINQKIKTASDPSMTVADPLDMHVVTSDDDAKGNQLPMIPTHIPPVVSESEAIRKNGRYRSINKRNAAALMKPSAGHTPRNIRFQGTVSMPVADDQANVASVGRDTGDHQNSSESELRSNHNSFVSKPIQSCKTTSSDSFVPSLIVVTPPIQVNHHAWKSPLVPNTSPSFDRTETTHPESNQININKRPLAIKKTVLPNLVVHQKTPDKSRVKSILKSPAGPAKRILVETPKQKVNLPKSFNKKTTHFKEDSTLDSIDDKPRVKLPSTPIGKFRLHHGLVSFGKKSQDDDENDGMVSDTPSELTNNDSILSSRRHHRGRSRDASSDNMRAKRGSSVQGKVSKKQRGQSELRRRNPVIKPYRPPSTAVSKISANNPWRNKEDRAYHYDSQSGLFSNFETEAKWESRREEQKRHSVEKQLRAEREHMLFKGDLRRRMAQVTSQIQKVEGLLSKAQSRLDEELQQNHEAESGLEAHPQDVKETVSPDSNDTSSPAFSKKAVEVQFNLEGHVQSANPSKRLNDMPMYNVAVRSSSRMAVKIYKRDVQQLRKSLEYLTQSWQKASVKPNPNSPRKYVVPKLVMKRLAKAASESNSAVEGNANSPLEAVPEQRNLKPNPPPKPVESNAIGNKVIRFSRKYITPGADNKKVVDPSHDEIVASNHQAVVVASVLPPMTGSVDSMDSDGDKLVDIQSSFGEYVRRKSRSNSIPSSKFGPSSLQTMLSSHVTPYYPVDSTDGVETLNHATSGGGFQVIDYGNYPEYTPSGTPPIQHPLDRKSLAAMGTESEGASSMLEMREGEERRGSLLFIDNGKVLSGRSSVIPSSSPHETEPRLDDEDSNATELELNQSTGDWYENDFDPPEVTNALIQSSANQVSEERKSRDPVGLADGEEDTFWYEDYGESNSVDSDFIRSEAVNQNEEVGPYAVSSTAAKSLHNIPSKAGDDEPMGAMDPSNGFRDLMDSIAHSQHINNNIEDMYQSSQVSQLDAEENYDEDEFYFEENDQMTD